MITHVKVLGWFNVVVGAMGMLTALLLLTGSSLLAAFVTAVEAESGIPAGVIALVGTVVCGVVAALSLPSLILGVGLLQFRPWARILGIVLAALHLLNVPIGTALSIYAFWVLLKPETEALFRQEGVLRASAGAGIQPGA